MEQVALYIKNLYLFLRRNARVTVTILFAAVLVLGLCFVNSYGVNYDVRSEDYILMTNLKAVVTKISPDTAKGINTFRNLPDIAEYKERDHGKAAYYPIGLFKLFRSPALSTYAWCYRAYTFLLCFAGLCFLYLTAKLLCGRRIYALLASALYWLSPRILADSYYNDKDMVFASLIIATGYFALKFIIEYEKKYSTAVWLGIFSAFACNTRIVGIILPFFALVFYIALTIKKRSCKNLRIYLPALTAVLVFAAVFVLITPAAWGGIIDYFKYNLSNSADFTRWNGTVYYLGEYYTVSDNTLPWHYLPVMIFNTTPLLITLLIITGVAVLVYRIVKRKIDLKAALLTMLLASSLLPLIFAIVSGSRVYNGWRHFYFIYSSLVLCAVCGIEFLVKRGEKIRRICKITAGSALTMGIITLFTVFPHGYAYYVFNGDSFEADYWNISSTQCIKQLLEKTDGQIKIAYSDKHSAAGLENAVIYLPAELRNRITVCGENQECDYIFINADYYAAAQHCGELFYSVDGLNECSSVKYKNRTLTAIYKN